MHEAEKCRTNINKKTYRILVIILVMIITFISTSFCVAFATPKMDKNDNKIVVGYPLLELENELGSKDTYIGYEYEYEYEYLKKIARDTDWNYEIIIDTRENCIQGLKDGSIDVMGFVSKNDERKQFLKYAKVSGGIVNALLFADEKDNTVSYRDFEALNGCRVGILKNSHLEILLDKVCQENSIKVEKVYYGTERKMFNALSKDGIDLALCTNSKTNLEIQKIRGISSNFFFFAVSMASANCNEIIEKLNVTINDALILDLDYNQNSVSAYIPKEEINQLEGREELGTKNHFLHNWIYKKPYVALSIATGFFCVMLLIMIVYIKERRNKEKVMHYNMVTKTWNFSKFSVEADKIFRRKRLSGKYVILHMNIAKFRFLNDIYGFEVGNKVLCTVGGMFKKFVKPGELYASLWADHFVCLVKCDSENELKRRTKDILEELNCEVLKICDFRIVVRVGAYFVTPEDIKNRKSVNNMIQYANHALSTIGDTYKNTLACFNQTLNVQFESLKLINKDMLKAFYNKEFVTYYQPKYNINTNEIIGAEALVRWIHPTKGLMYPCDFLPYFEKSGFIVEVDFYVFEETCKNMKRWIEEGKKLIKVSCNFSRLHCENEKFVQTVKRIAQKYQVPFEFLELELTETIMVEEMGLITKQIKELHDIGFSVSIDDFGSGYSSLSVLQQLKVDTIKLDKTFIENGIPNEREYKVMQAIVELAEQLQMSVICEGVETIEQVELLRQVRCDYVQGFYFAKPMPVEELNKLMLSRK